MYVGTICSSSCYHTTLAVKHFLILVSLSLNATPLIGYYKIFCLLRIYFKKSFLRIFDIYAGYLTLGLFAYAVEEIMPWGWSRRFHPWVALLIKGAISFAIKFYNSKIEEMVNECSLFSESEGFLMLHRP